MLADPTEPHLKVIFWDVGQGDCSTIELPDGSVIIIDTGPKGSPLVDWLGLPTSPKRVHAIVTTHNDSDHVGSLPAILGIGKPVEHIWMLVDRKNPLDQKPTSELFDLVIKGARQKRWLFDRLEIRKIIWESAALRARLEVVFPEFADNIETVDANKPNEASAIVQLVINGQVQVIWPGDAPLETASTVCSNTSPYLLMGPHHGSPSGYDKLAAASQIAQINPGKSYISVGTTNKYNHPRAKYIRQLTAANICVYCSQITRQCDKHQTEEIQKSVMLIHTALGLLPPRSGYACRGPLILYFGANGFIKDDGFTERHKKLSMTLERPLCHSSNIPIH